MSSRVITNIKTFSQDLAKARAIFLEVISHLAFAGA